MEEGSVKWFDDAKGYGIILRDKGGEVVVHQAAIRATGLQTLQKGQRVQFAAIRGLKGLQAENIRGALIGISTRVRSASSNFPGFFRLGLPRAAAIHRRTPLRSSQPTPTLNPHDSEVACRRMPIVPTF